MAHRKNFEKATKNYKAISGQFENCIKSIVETLMLERNELKSELIENRTKLLDMEKKYSRADTTIKVLREQLRGAQHVAVHTEMFAKGVLDIAQKLATDDKPYDDTDKDSETRTLIATFTSPKDATPKETTPRAVYKEKSTENNNENANDDNFNLANAPENMEVANEEVVVDLDRDEPEDDLEMIEPAEQQRNVLPLSAVIKL